MNAALSAAFFLRQFGDKHLVSVYMIALMVSPILGKNEEGFFTSSL
ncbi:hypothetical protein EMIT0P218_30192 [Pseudomonas sp. IT-P218]